MVHWDKNVRGHEFCRVEISQGLPVPVDGRTVTNIAIRGDYVTADVRIIELGGGTQRGHDFPPIITVEANGIGPSEGSDFQELHLFHGSEWRDAVRYVRGIVGSDS